MSGPLEGLRVVDCSRGMAGPRATGILADYGADVVWVEPPGGDPWRAELAAPYSVYLRGKRSIALDLHDDAEREVLHALLAGADVFVESWRPGIGDRLGLGYPALRDRYPALVACSISGFGGDGPDAGLGGYDPIVHAVLGTMGDQAGFRDGPIFVPGPTASNGAAYLALIGILASLYRRYEDGFGRRVETSLLDGMLAYVSQAWGYSDRNRDRYRTGGTRFLIKTLRCADDEYVGVHTGARGAFDRLMELVGLDDRVPVVEGGSEASTPLTPDEDAAIAKLPDIFVTATRDEWLTRLLDAQVCGMPVMRPCEVFDEPQTVHNRMVVEVDDALLGRVSQVAPPATFSAAPPSQGDRTPQPNEHGNEIRAVLANGTWTPRPSVSLTPDERPLLDGVRVVDIGHWFAGPYASRLLADLGADVVKVEPLAGDPMRGLERPFSTAQAGKRSLTIDLTATAAEPVARRLLEWADVVHHNLRPGVAERLGMGFADAQAANPELVYLHASGWGATGPYADRQSFAPLMGGYVGSHYEAGGQFNPPVDPVANEDSGGGLIGAMAVLMGLLHRRRAGTGQFIEAPHFHCAMSDIAHIVRRTDDDGVIGAEMLDPMQFGTDPLCRLYATADGWICIVAVADRHLTALGEVLGLTVLKDPSVASSDVRLERAYELEAALFEACGSQPTANLVAQLRAVGVPAAEPRINNNRAFMDDDHHLRIGRVAEYVHPRFGRTRESGVLIRFDGARVPEHRRPPELGEHSDDVLAELGFTNDEMAALVAQGVLSAPSQRLVSGVR
jgi:crotonobetainyl-CoA:carnitine CoA-transferase CaiB-like acyl-CoA transferase